MRLPGKPAGARRVWLQAVSVGEMLAVGPILEGLARDGLEVYLDDHDEHGPSAGERTLPRS